MYVTKLCSFKNSKKFPSSIRFLFFLIPMQTKKNIFIKFRINQSDFFLIKDFSYIHNIISLILHQLHQLHLMLTIDLRGIWKIMQS